MDIEEVFNEKAEFIAGDIVKYWRGLKDDEPSGVGEITRIYTMPSGTDVAFIEGCRGCIALTHMEKDVGK